MAREPRAKPAEKLMPVEREQNYQYVYADHWAAALSPSGDVELSALLIRNKFVGQNYRELKKGTEEFLAMGTMVGQPSLVEGATIRMRPDTALEAAEILIRHLRSHDLVSQERIMVLLKSTGALD